MIEYVSHGKESMAGKKVAISGSGNVAQYAARKVIQLGGIVCSLSDSKGAIVAMTGRAIDAEMIQITSEIKTMRKPLVDVASTTAFKGKVRYLAAARPWLHVTDVDVALPCATQNELSGEEAVGLIKAGCKYVAERSNMGCTKEAVQVFELHRKEMKGNATWYAPGKAANAGGVAVSGLEMAQSCSRTFWTFDELDNKLKHIMKDCFDNGLNTAIKYMTVAEGELPSLVAGSNISGFVRVAKAMHDQGDWW
jgi:glutamate dehydrogenase (NADP+)